MFEVRGISRFASAFETAPLYSDEKGKTERLLARRQPLRARDQRKSAMSGRAVKMAATVPPCTPAGGDAGDLFSYRSLCVRR